MLVSFFFRCEDIAPFVAILLKACFLCVYFGRYPAALRRGRCALGSLALIASRVGAETQLCPYKLATAAVGGSPPPT